MSASLWAASKREDDALMGGDGYGQPSERSGKAELHSFAPIPHCHLTPTGRVHSPPYPPFTDPRTTVLIAPSLTLSAPAAASGLLCSASISAPTPSDSTMANRPGYTWSYGWGERMDAFTPGHMDGEGKAAYMPESSARLSPTHSYLCQAPQRLTAELQHLDVLLAPHKPRQRYARAPGHRIQLLLLSGEQPDEDAQCVGALLRLG